MTASHGHLLQLALAAFVADRTIVGMIDHGPLDDMLAQLHGIGIG